MVRLSVRQAVVPLGLLAVGAALLLSRAPHGVSAQPGGLLPDELRYVPADAALFVHADVAKLWGGAVGKSVRDADPKTFADLSAQAKTRFGMTPDQLRSVTLFWPKMAGPRDGDQFGAVFVFNAAYDRAALKAGFEKLLPKFALEAPSARVAVLLVGLSDKYGKPGAGDKPGPLSAAIREAATGTHVLVAGATPANLPAELRGDDVPAPVKPFRPLLAAESITGLIDLDREVAVEVRVKSETAMKAGEAKQALDLLTGILGEGMDATRMFGKDVERDAEMKDVLAVFKAAKAGVAAAKATAVGSESRLRVAVPADLPLASAYLTGTKRVRAAAARVTSLNNLRQLALGLHSYETGYGSLPPAATADKAGKPLLSWRVLILPYVEEDELFKQFKLDEPWDGENNKKLLDKMPKVFAMPVPTAAKPNETHYQAFVGNGALFDLVKGPRIAGITDGTSNTIMVATAATPVPWTKPDDLAFDPDKDATKLLGFFPGDACPVAFADGSVRNLKKTIVKKTLHALITRAGGEVVDPDE